MCFPAVPTHCLRSARRERSTQPAASRMYIAALSANLLEGHSAAACAAMGLDAFLGKPLRPEDIAALWQTACARAAPRELP